MPVANGKKPAAGTYHLNVTATYAYGTLSHVVKQRLVLTVG